MAIEDDFSVAVNGDIRATTPAQTWRPIDLHRMLQGLADNQETAAASDDIVDITTETPSERITDEIIVLKDWSATGGPRFNIDAATAEWLYGGSIRQGSGATEELYSGLRVLGSVQSTGTQVQVVQDKALYDGDVPFWGDQVSPFNGGGNVLCRFLVRSRIAGCDIDKKKVKVQIRNYGDTFATFDVTLGDGEAVAAVSSVDDPQNDTLKATVNGYTHVTNVEGYQLIDIGDGNGNQPYYSKWTYGADTSGDQLKAVWEWAKAKTETGVAGTLHGIDGELFVGITHEWLYDTEVGGPFTEDEEIVWGTSITYDTLAGGTFTQGFYVRIGASGYDGRIMYDPGAAGTMVVALATPGVTINDGDTITEYNPSTGAATGVTAAVNVTVTDADKEGGSGLLLADDSTGNEMWVQLRTGEAPVDNLPLRGLTSGATALVAGAVTTRTVTPVFLGSYVGTLIGGFGIGVEPGDLTSSDTVTDLDGDVNTPPNNVTWTLFGIVSGEDYCLVGPKDAGDLFDWDQQTLATALSGATETQIDVGVGNIPANTPASGTVRVTLNDGRIRYQTYSSHDGSQFYTIPSTDYTGANAANIGNGVMVSYIDKLAAATSEAFTTIYTAPLTLWVRVRDGGGTPIKTFQVASNLTATGGSATASRISDA